METLTEKREGTISQNFCQYNVGLSKYWWICRSERGPSLNFFVKIMLHCQSSVIRTILTNLNHLDAEFDEKSKPIPFAVSKGTNEYSGQSEHSELIRPLVVLQARGRISLWNAQPIGCDPGGVLEITFFLEKKMILLHRSPAGRLCRPPTG